MNRPRVLCLDIEGGHGGSSRSLYQSLAYLSKSDAEVEVWCRRAGVIQSLYAGCGIPCSVVPSMPHVSSLPRFSRNLYVYTRAFLKYPASRAFRGKLSAVVNERFDIVHFNHEALFLLARWLRSRTQIPFTIHIRTCPAPSAFSRWQARTIKRTVDSAVFITENEKSFWQTLGYDPDDGRVIYNIAGASPEDVEPHSGIPNDRRLKVASLCNFAWIRGVDRFVDIAAALAARRRRDILFVMAGDMRLRGSLPGELGTLSRQGADLKEYATTRGVADMFLFLGHVSEPERVLAGCDVLARLSREDNPWGRDVIAALSAARPVIASGGYDRFVETDKTGILLPTFSVDALVDNILRLADDRALLDRLGAAGRARIENLCNGTARAKDLAAVWQSAARK